MSYLKLYSISYIGCMGYHHLGHRDNVNAYITLVLASVSRTMYYLLQYLVFMSAHVTTLSRTMYYLLQYVVFL